MTGVIIRTVRVDKDKREDHVITKGEAKEKGLRMKPILDTLILDF